MIFRKNSGFDAELRRRIQQGVTEVGKDYLGAVIEVHEGAPRGGTALNRYGRPRSAPGEPPAMETGALRGAMGLQPSGYNVIRVTLDDPEVAAYAAYLENGTRKMAARKMWEPVLLEKAPDLARAFVRGFQAG